MRDFKASCERMMRSEASRVGLWLLSIIAPWVLVLILNLAVAIVGQFTGSGSGLFWRWFYEPIGFWIYVFIIFFPGAFLAILLLRNAAGAGKVLFTVVFLLLGCGSYLFLLLLLGFTYVGL